MMSLKKRSALILTLGIPTFVVSVAHAALSPATIRVGGDGCPQGRTDFKVVGESLIIEPSVFLVGQQSQKRRSCQVAATPSHPVKSIIFEGASQVANGVEIEFQAEGFTAGSQGKVLREKIGARDNGQFRVALQMPNSETCSLNSIQRAALSARVIGAGKSLTQIQKVSIEYDTSKSCQ